MSKCIFGGFWGCQLTGGASLLVEHVSAFMLSHPGAFIHSSIHPSVLPSMAEEMIVLNETFACNRYPAKHHG